MVDLGLLAHHTAPVVGCFFNGSSSVAKLVTPVAALLLRKMLRKLDLKHGEAHAAQRLGGSAAARSAVRCKRELGAATVQTGYIGNRSDRQHG